MLSENQNVKGEWNDKAQGLYRKYEGYFLVLSKIRVFSFEQFEFWVFVFMFFKSVHFGYLCLGSSKVDILTLYT